MLKDHFCLRFLAQMEKSQMPDYFLKLEANNLKTVLFTKIIFLIHKFKYLKLCQFTKENFREKNLFWGRGTSLSNF